MADAFINTISTDLQSEVTRLSSLLLQAKAKILAQATTIATHVETLDTANSAVSKVTTDLKAQLDDFENLLTGNNVSVIVNNVTQAVNNAAHVAADIVVNTVNPVAETLVVAAVSQAVPVVAPVAPVVANAVITVLDDAIHKIADATGNAVPATLHNLQELEAAYAKIMANSTTSILPANGIVQKLEHVVETIVTDVKTEVVDVVEGKAKIGPLTL